MAGTHNEPGGRLQKSTKDKSPLSSAMLLAPGRAWPDGRLANAQLRLRACLGCDPAGAGALNDHGSLKVGHAGLDEVLTLSRDAGKANQGTGGGPGHELSCRKLCRAINLIRDKERRQEKLSRLENFSVSQVLQLRDSQ